MNMSGADLNRFWQLKSALRGIEMLVSLPKLEYLFSLKSALRGIEIM